MDPAAETSKWCDPNKKRSRQRIVWRVSSICKLLEKLLFNIFLNFDLLFILLSILPQNSGDTIFHKVLVQRWDVFFPKKNQDRPTGWKRNLDFHCRVNALRWMVRRTNLKWCGLEVDQIKSPKTMIKPLGNSERCVFFWSMEYQRFWL